MIRKFLTLVTNEKFVSDEIIKFIKENFSIQVLSYKNLSDSALELTIEFLDELKMKQIEKKFNDKKIDICFRDINTKKFKKLMCDMDATVIENETLDDLVKITGSKMNVDQSSKLAMEGKADLKTTLNNRVEVLKGKSKSLIEEVLKGIKFNPGGEVMVRTLNSLGFESSLVTGGFKPISTFVGNKLGFHNIISNEFNFDENNHFTGDYIPITDEKNSKYKYMKKISEEKNITFDEILSVGDGSNDLEMLKHSGLGIGYYAHQIIKDNIKTQIKFTDLKTILFFIGISENQFVT